MRCLTFVITFCILGFHASAQMPEKWRMRTDSMFVVAKDTSVPVEERLKTYGRISFTVYKDLEYGKQISLEYLRTAQRSNNLNHEINALTFVGFVYLTEGDLDSAEYFYTREFYLADSSSNESRTAGALANLGILYETRGDLDKSLAYHLQSLEICDTGTAKGLSMLKARAKINTGHVYELQGQYLKSIETLQEALDLCFKNNATGYFASTYIHLGEVNAAIGEDTTAEKYFREAYSWATKNYNHGKRIQSLEKLAGLFEVRGMNDSALVYYEKALALAEEQQMKLYLATAKCGIGRVLFANGDYQQALALAEEAIVIFENDDLVVRKEEALLLSGKAAFRLGQYDLCKKRLTQAYELSEKNRKIKSWQQACYGLYELYKKIGDNTSALMYFEEYSKLIAEQRSEDAMKAIIKQDIKEGFRKKQEVDSLRKTQEIAALEVMYSESEKAQERKVYFAFGALAFLLAVFLIGFYLYRQKRNSNLLLAEKNGQIEQALRDKEVLLREVNHRVKNNMQLVSSLLLLKSKNTNDPNAREALLDSQSRISSMQLAHQKMYQEENYETIEITQYVHEIIQLLVPVALAGSVDCKLTGKKINIHVEQAQSVGFILHELITNSMKHAWEPAASDKKVSICIETSGNLLQIEYSDNGKGLPSGFDLPNAQSFGLRLINSLVERQLMGVIRSTGQSGFGIIVEFKRR